MGNYNRSTYGVSRFFIAEAWYSIEEIKDLLERARYMEQSMKKAQQESMTVTDASDGGTTA